jgi:hypothetical protein
LFDPDGVARGPSFRFYIVSVCGRTCEGLDGTLGGRLRYMDAARARRAGGVRRQRC